MRNIFKGILGLIAADILYQLILSVPVSAILAWSLNILRTKDTIAVVFSSFPPPYFWPIFMIVLLIISFKPAVVDPINRRRIRQQEEEQRKLNDLIVQIDNVIEQFHLCFTVGAEDEFGPLQPEYFLKLEHMVHAIYTQIKDYNPPDLKDWDRFNNSHWYSFFIDLRSSLPMTNIHPTG